MFTVRELRAMAWGYCFSIPLGALCIWLQAPLWFSAIVLMAGIVPTLLKLNE
jgi:hypothetical protein